MASQLMAVSSNKKLRRNQTAELNARRQLLPQIIDNQRRREELERQEELKQIQISQFNRQHALAQDQFSTQKSQFKKTQSAQEKAAKIGMGLSAGKMGLTVANKFGGKTIGDVVGGAKSMFTGGAAGKPSFLGSNISLGTAFGSGLVGFGASQMFGGKKKAKKAGVGAAAGALTGMLTGSSGNTFSDTLTGAVSGGFGGLF